MESHGIQNPKKYEPCIRIIKRVFPKNRPGLEVGPLNPHYTVTFRPLQHPNVIDLKKIKCLLLGGNPP